MNKKINIVYIITKLELGGAQKVCLSLFNGLTEFGHTTHLISGVQGPLVAHVKNKKYVYLLDSMTREVSWGTFLDEIKNFIKLIKMLHSLRKKSYPLIIHTHSTKAGLIGRWAAFFARVPIRIHTIHGYGFHSYQSSISWSVIYLLEWITSLITTHFICVSTQDAKKGSSFFPRFSHKHSIIRAGIDMHPFLKRSSPCLPAEKLFVFGTIACFKPQKNLVDLLTAFQSVYRQEPKARLEIIGDGIQRPFIEQWIAKQNLRNVITLLGWQKSVAPFMQTWHAFALSSLWEGLPCAIIEARIMQLPVISYSVGGIHEVITHEENGLLCPAKNVAALAHNMLQIVQKPQLHQKLKTFKDNLIDFDNYYMIQKHQSLYKKLLSK